MDINYQADLTDDERAIVQAWVDAHYADGFRYVTIGVEMVVVHGGYGQSGVATRNPGHLASDLDRAVIALRTRLNR